MLTTITGTVLSFWYGSIMTGMWTGSTYITQFFDQHHILLQSNVCTRPFTYLMPSLFYDFKSVYTTACSPVKDTVVVNDHWGHVRYEHGD